MTYRALPSSPPRLFGHCTLSSSCRQVCVLPAVASPADAQTCSVRRETLAVEAIIDIRGYVASSRTYELCNETTADATSHHVVQVGTPHGAFQVCRERS